MAISGSRAVGVAKYCLLPQIMPRVAALLLSGFEFFAYFIAQVYRGVRLLPEGHPFLNPAEIGNFTIRDVISAAGRRLNYRRENIDQIIIYYAILLGLFLMVVQAFWMVVMLFSPQMAMAAGFSLQQLFGNAHLTVGRDPYQDIAFILLDRVFGIPGIFDSCVSMASPCYMAAPNDTWDNAATVYTPPTFPWPFHLALQAMFMFYSVGILIVAMMILLYFVVVIVAETAQTGTPFGKRFNKVYAPLRLVVALGLLIPISHGLNSAQYIVLYAAKLGSNFATNGWIVFNSKLVGGRMFEEDMVAMPKSQNIMDVLQFAMLAHACKAVQEGMLVQEPKPASWRPSGGANCPVDGGDQRNDSVINGYLVKATGNGGADAVLLSETDFDTARRFFNNGDMMITFGDRGCTDRHNKSAGHVLPICGQVLVTNPTQEMETQEGAYIIQKGYYDLVQHLWGNYGGAEGATNIWTKWGFCHNQKSKPVQNVETQNYNTMVNAGTGDDQLRVRALGPLKKQCLEWTKIDGVDYQKDTAIVAADPLTAEWIRLTYASYMSGDMTPAPALVGRANGSSSPKVATAIVTNIIRSGVLREREATQGGKYNIPIDLIDRGWGGAGIWYNKVARANGAITGAALATPKVTKFPELMEAVAIAKMRNNKNVSPASLFTPSHGEDSSLQMRREGEAQGAIGLQGIYSAWRGVANEYKPTSGNFIYDFINWLFGTQGLFDLRDPGNQQTHPLGLLTSLGKSLLEASIRNIGLATMGGLGGSFLGNDNPGGALASGMSSMLFTIVGMTIGAGVILYYVLPFMPFVYFFFAVGSWVKSIFEAMVGAPLWALAHIRIDGEGLPGGAALSGYFMIFEIFIRPITIVFGLIAAVSIFSAMASTLNAIFDIAVVNAGGANYGNNGQQTFMSFVRGPVDQLFYTVMYAVLLYIMAMSSFKLIDLIPQNIMRWMGASVSSFANQTGDSAKSLMDNMTTQGSSTVSQAVGGIQQAGNAVGGTLGSVMRSATPKS